MMRARIGSDYDHSPRSWENLGIIAYKHSRHTLGEEVITDPVDWLEDKLGLQRSYKYNNDHLADLERRFFDKYHALPLYLFDHGGLRINTTGFSCPWDSEQVGYIYATPERIREHFDVKRISKKIRDSINKILLEEVKALDQYFSGDVYYVEIIDDDRDVIDSYGGFFGSDVETNGMLDNFDEKYHDLIRKAEVC
jgi:hypothetical protein